jgi:hypothetical protein
MRTQADCAIEQIEALYAACDRAVESYQNAVKLFKQQRDEATAYAKALQDWVGENCKLTGTITTAPIKPEWME